MMELIRDGIKVELEDIGEGQDGDYQPDDPEDEPLLRFSFYEFSIVEGEWQEINDTSYCTQLSANLPKHDQHLALEWLMTHFDRKRAKKCCERLSWVTIEDVKGE
jgi:hypothetical protein